MSIHVVSRARGHRAQPVDVSVVIGTKKVDVHVETAGALVDVVGGIRGEIGVFAVGLDEHAILVVTEIGRAQPDGAILLEDMALFP